jgi:hypothetical protein
VRKLDQNGNSARVAFHGLGLMRDRRADTSEEIASAVDRVLTDPRFGENVEAMRERHGGKQISISDRDVERVPGNGNRRRDERLGQVRSDGL